MEQTESSRAESAAVVLKKALPSAVSQLLVIGVVVAVGLSVWGIWYAWDSYQYWQRNVKDKPVTWLDGRLFTDLDMWDYMDTAEDPTGYALIHVYFLMHFGHEIGVIRHPESIRALDRSLRQAKNSAGETPGLLWLMNEMGRLMDRRMIHVDDPFAENLCDWMYTAFVEVQEQHPDEFWSVYNHWLNPRKQDPDADFGRKAICHMP